MTRGEKRFLAGDLGYHVPTFPRMALLAPTFEEVIAARTGQSTSLTIAVRVAMDIVGTPLHGIPIEVVDQGGTVVASTQTDGNGFASAVVGIDPTPSIHFFTVTGTVAGPPQIVLTETVTIR